MMSDEPSNEGAVVAQYRPLVFKIAGSWIRSLGHWVEFEDLVAIGMEALLHAVRSYSPKHETTLITYAYHVIDNRFGKELKHWRRKKRAMSGFSLKFDHAQDDDDEADGFVVGKIILPSEEPSAEALVISYQERERIADLIKALPEKMQCVLHSRFIHDEILQQTGDRLGVTRERARQIEAAALRRLRKVLDGNQE